MLVLTRTANQSIMIGDDIEVSVVSVRGGNVRIGIRAPDGTGVLRTEIYLEVNGAGGVRRALGDGGDGPLDAEHVDRALRGLGE